MEYIWYTDASIYQETESIFTQENPSAVMDTQTISYLDYIWHVWSSSFFSQHLIIRILTVQKKNNQKAI